MRTATRRRACDERAVREAATASASGTSGNGPSFVTASVSGFDRPRDEEIRRASPGSSANSPSGSPNASRMSNTSASGNMLSSFRSGSGARLSSDRRIGPSPPVAMQSSCLRESRDPISIDRKSWRYAAGKDFISRCASPGAAAPARGLVPAASLRPASGRIFSLRCGLARPGLARTQRRQRASSGWCPRNGRLR
jgi:hypothetical protein